MISGGSGTHLGHGLVITNRHVAERVGNRVLLRFGMKRCAGQVVKVCRFSDLAAIYSEEAKNEPAAELADAVIADEQIWKIGFPANNGRHQHVSTGRMRGSVRVNWGTSNTTDAHSSSGDSGGGIFNADGKLVGVLWGGPETICCTFKDTKKFIEEECITWWPGRLGGAPNPNKPSEPRVPDPGPVNPVVPAPDLSTFKAEILAVIKTEMGKIPTGPAGPAGSPGVTGPVGPAGPAGKPGADATPFDVSAILAKMNDIDKLQTRLAELERKFGDIHIRVVPRPNP